MQMEGMCSFPRGDLLLDGRESFQHSFNFDFTNRGWSDPASPFILVSTDGPALLEKNISPLLQAADSR